MRVSRNWHLTGIIGTTPEAPSGTTSRQRRRKPSGLQDTERPGQGPAGDLVRLPPRWGVQREVGHRPVGKLVDGGNASSCYPVEIGDVLWRCAWLPGAGPARTSAPHSMPGRSGRPGFPGSGAVAYPVEGVLHRDGVEVGERPSAVVVAVRPEAVVVDVGVLLTDRAEGSLSAGIAQGHPWQERPLHQNDNIYMFLRALQRLIESPAPFKAVRLEIDGGQVEEPDAVQEAIDAKLNEGSDE